MYVVQEVPGTKDFISSLLDVSNDKPGVCSVLIPFPLGVSEDVVRLGHSTLAFYMQSCLGCVCVLLGLETPNLCMLNVYIRIYIFLCIYIILYVYVHMTQRKCVRMTDYTRTKQTLT